jgi:hypothetical protein
MASLIFRRHRVVQRSASHAKLSERYGLVPEGLTNARHLVPFASLADGEVVGLDPRKYSPCDVPIAMG